MTTQKTEQGARGQVDVSVPCGFFILRWKAGRPKWSMRH